MGYFTETMTIFEKQSFKDTMKNAVYMGISPVPWARCFDDIRGCTYSSKKTGDSYIGVFAFNQAQVDYCNNGSAKDIRNKQKKFTELCRKANIHEEYNLNKVLGI